jgi:phosphocarrier protein
LTQEKEVANQETKSRDMVLLNRYGMHVRPAGLFAKVASRFKADVKVEKDRDGNVVSGKSIMALMTLEAVCGSTLTVTATGPEADRVLDELEALVKRKFDIPDEQ